MARTAKSPVQLDIAGPVRTCVGCRERAAKSELLRVVAGSGDDGRKAVVPDPSATAAGRGAHLHPSTECFELAVRKRAFPRALRVHESLAVDDLTRYLEARRPTKRLTDQKLEQ